MIRALRVPGDSIAKIVDFADAAINTLILTVQKLGLHSGLGEDRGLHRDIHAMTF
jgi:hypothetical protein